MTIYDEDIIEVRLRLYQWLDLLDGLDFLHRAANMMAKIEIADTIATIGSQLSAADAGLPYPGLEPVEPIIGTGNRTDCDDDHREEGTQSIPI